MGRRKLPRAALALVGLALAACAWAANASAADTTAPHLVNVQPYDGAFVNSASAAGGGLGYVPYAFVVQDNESALDLGSVRLLVWSEGEQRYIATDSFSVSEYGTAQTALGLQ